MVKGAFLLLIFDYFEKSLLYQKHYVSLSQIEFNMNQYYTYILANSSDTTLYIGVTNDIERRVAEHRSGTIPGFTQKYKCHKLVYFESFSDVEQAIAREKQLKKWSRAKKDALIDTMNKDRTDLMP